MSASDDGLITAYAFGELEEADLARIETLLKADGTARAELEKLRQFASALTQALTNEPIPQTPNVAESVSFSSADRASAHQSLSVRWLYWALPVAAAIALGFTLGRIAPKRAPASTGIEKSASTAPVAPSLATIESNSPPAVELIPTTRVRVQPSSRATNVQVISKVAAITPEQFEFLKAQFHLPSNYQLVDASGSHAHTDNRLNTLVAYSTAGMAQPAAPSAMNLSFSPSLKMPPAFSIPGSEFVNTPVDSGQGGLPAPAASSLTDNLLQAPAQNPRLARVELNYWAPRVPEMYIGLSAPIMKRYFKSSPKIYYYTPDPGFAHDSGPDLREGMTMQISRPISEGVDPGFLVLALPKWNDPPLPPVTLEVTPPAPPKKK